MQIFPDTGQQAEEHGDAPKDGETSRGALGCFPLRRREFQVKHEQQKLKRSPVGLGLRTLSREAEEATVARGHRTEAQRGEGCRKPLRSTCVGGLQRDQHPHVRQTGQGQG